MANPVSASHLSDRASLGVSVLRTLEVEARGINALANANLDPQGENSVVALEVFEELLGPHHHDRLSDVISSWTTREAHA